jgi:dienelactone hydrolase
MFPLSRLAVSLALLAASVLATAAGAAPIITPAGPDGPAQREIPPPSGTGRVVIVISGKMGPDYYQDVAERVAKLGYDTILLSGDDILNPDRQGGMRLGQTIERAKSSTHALPGKVGVIGFSEGGGGALFFATQRPETVAVVVMFYPETAFLLKAGADLKHLASNFKVPALVLQGGKDDFKNCCVPATIGTIAADAKEAGKVFDLVVYPEANHDFIKGANYRASDAADAWKRTAEALKQSLSE